MTFLMKVLHLWSVEECQVSKLHIHFSSIVFTTKFKHFVVSTAAPVRGIDSIYGSGSGLITLDNVVCTGSESNLLSCQHNPIFEHNCQHYEDVAVICGSE